MVPSRTCPFFFFFVPTGHHRRGTRDLLTFAGTSHGEDEVYFFSRSRRAILGTLPASRRASPLPRPLRLSQHATCHGGVSVTSLRHAGSAGLCPTTSCGWARRSPVALTFTRLTLPRACLRFGSRSSLCPVSLLTRKPKMGGVFLTVGEIKEKKEKGKEGEGEKRGVCRKNGTNIVLCCFISQAFYNSQV